MFSLDKLLQERYSCRQFDTSKTVAVEHIQTIIKASTLAPSACNKQPYFFFGIGQQSMERLKVVRPWYDAQAMILACRDQNEPSWVRPTDSEPFFPFDLGLSMMAMSLKAHELGLGSCFIASFNPDQMRNILSIDQSYDPYIALVVGYPLQVPGENHFKRKDLHTISTIIY